MLGAAAAAELGVGRGDFSLSDEASPINLAGSYPLKMPIVGVLAPTGSPDDHGIFVDLKTGWVIAGIGHGHTDLADPEQSGFLSERSEQSITANPAVVTCNETTPDNIGSFHFHSARSAHFDLPVTSIIAIPNSDKDRTLLKGRYSAASNTQLLVPTEIIDELMGIVFQVKRFFRRQLLPRPAQHASLPDLGHPARIAHPETRATHHVPHRLRSPDHLLDPDRRARVSAFSRRGHRFRA